MKTKKEYFLACKEAGYTGSDEALSAEWIKLKRKAYRKVLKEFTKRLELALTIEQYTILGNAAKERGMRIGQFAVNVIFASLQNLPMPQGREDLLNEFVAATRRVGNLINQLVRKSHQKDNLFLDDIMLCHHLLQGFVEQGLEILSRELDWLEELDRRLELNPSLIQPFTAIVLKHIAKKGNGNDW
jgi:hypothetical protein